MTHTISTSTAFWRGFRQGLPFLLVIVPFGLLFGVAATEAGLSLMEVMGFTVLVVAGASQFTALQLMTDHAPTVLVIFTSLAVNLRMAMYSASLAPYLGKAGKGRIAMASYLLTDQVFALATQEYENRPKTTIQAKLAFYLGGCTPVVPLWYIATFAGAWLGAAIPPEFALDFAVPITFLAMIGPALRSLAHVAAAFVSVAGALLLAFMPAGTGLLVAALAAMVTGAQVELWQARRAAR